MSVISAIVAKYEFVEIGIDVLAAKAVICPEAPSSHQRESPMNPRQDNVRGHLADDARIMPIACQPRIGFVAVREQRGSTFHVGVYEGRSRRRNCRKSSRGECGRNACRDIWRACVAVWLDSCRAR